MEENKTFVTAQVDTEIKEKAEKILSELGLTGQQAVDMFYRQIVFWNGLPFRPSIPAPPPFPHCGKGPFEKAPGAPGPGFEDRGPAPAPGGFGFAGSRNAPPPPPPFGGEAPRMDKSAGKSPEEELRDQISSNIEQARKFLNSTELGKIFNDIKKEIGL